MASWVLEEQSRAANNRSVTIVFVHVFEARMPWIPVSECVTKVKRCPGSRWWGAVVGCPLLLISKWLEATDEELAAHYFVMSVAAQPVTHNVSSGHSPPYLHCFDLFPLFFLENLNFLRLFAFLSDSAMGWCPAHDAFTAMWDFLHSEHSLSKSVTYAIGTLGMNLLVLRTYQTYFTASYEVSCWQ